LEISGLRVFFYGLFMDADVLREHGAHPTGACRVSVPGFSLVIGQRATLVPDPEGRVYGMLMDLSSGEIERLYSEPSVRMYRPEAVLAELDDGSPVAALCFNLPEPPPPDERNEGYAQRLRDVARRLALPESYVERIS
jgi:hypothetical protein